jgi:hypothetical protein
MWGNPFMIGARIVMQWDEWKKRGQPDRASMTTIRTTGDAVNFYRAWALSFPHYIRSAQKELRGKNLACWCPLCERHKEGRPLGVSCPDCQPCHVDELLELANA